MLIQTATRNDCIVMNYSFETYEFNLREYYMPTKTYDIAERFSERFGEFFYAVQAYIPKIQFFELLSVIMELESWVHSEYLFIYRLMHTIMSTVRIHYLRVYPIFLGVEINFLLQFLVKMTYFEKTLHFLCIWSGQTKISIKKSGNKTAP